MRSYAIAVKQGLDFPEVKIVMEEDSVKAMLRAIYFPMEEWGKFTTVEQVQKHFKLRGTEISKPQPLTHNLYQYMSREGRSSMEAFKATGGT